MKFVFLIPLFPLLGFLFNFTSACGCWAAGRRAHGRTAATATTPATAAAAPRAVPDHRARRLRQHRAVVRVRARGGPAAHAAPDHTLVETLWTWIPAAPPRRRHGGRAAPFNVDWAYQVDPLSSVMILVVTGVGFLIHVYSTGYMAHDAGLLALLRYLNLFMFFMLTLVLANNYVLMFVGWEGVGLCSYLLIGF